jgi:hypothetical protein
MAAKWYDEQPKNRNFLAPNGFKLDLDLFAGVDFYCQRAAIPDISVPNAIAQTPFRPIPIISSGGLSYGDLRVSFIIDEDMTNYINVWNWIQKNNLAEGFSDTEPEYSDGRLLILNSNFTENIIIGFEKLFPVDLSEVSFDVADTEVEYLTADVTFKFIRYTFYNKRMKTL